LFSVVAVPKLRKKARPPCFSLDNDEEEETCYQAIVNLWFEKKAIVNLMGLLYSVGLIAGH
jgi:hypothetical protein